MNKLKLAGIVSGVAVLASAITGNIAYQRGSEKGKAIGYAQGLNEGVTIGHGNGYREARLSIARDFADMGVTNPVRMISDHPSIPPVPVPYFRADEFVPNQKVQDESVDKAERVRQLFQTGHPLPNLYGNEAFQNWINPPKTEKTK